MPSKLKERSQISMDDTFLKDPELEALLEKRQELKQGVSDYRAADKAAKAKLATVTQPMPYRIGRFIISKSEHQAHEVNFEVGVTSSISIKLATE
jgi:hypothetical protein